MPSTTNFGWTTPADTDLVKDGAAAIRTLGNGVDSSFVDLKGGTSGQILAKNSNTDLDFVWVANDQGDITAVTAGTGISGGGTSGAVTITNSMATEITASGDIIVGTGSGTFDNLPIGSTGQVLTADTTVSPYKVKWATPAGGGKVLQVVSATSTTDTSITSTTFTDANLTATITPTLATSKILVLITATVFAGRNSTSNTNDAQIMRNATVATNFGNQSYFHAIGAAGATIVEKHDTKAFHFLDSPASTSALVYKLQGRVSTTANSNTLRFQPDASTSSILLLEIGA